MPLALGNLKECSGCKTVKELSFFCKHSRSKDKVQNWCKSCKAKANRNRKYAMKSGFYEIKVKEQKGLCGICIRPTEKLYVDHCHETGKLRELLCLKCNSLLGMASDRLDILINAMKYIQRWQRVEE